ncbi:hypothetical protein IE077_000556, partial [Cardiosporidium cionae]
ISEGSFNLHRKTTKCGLKTIIFTETRFSAYLIHKYLQMRNVVRSDMAVGSNETTRFGKIIKTSNASQKTVLARFAETDETASKRIDCLVSTIVMAEGIDVPACNLVIRFDSVKTPVDNIQCRGRARKASAVYVHFIEDEKHEEKLDMWEQYDKILMEVTERGLSNTSIIPISRRLVDYKPVPLYEPTTGASLAMWDALSYLFEIYQKYDSLFKRFIQFGKPPLSKSKHFVYNENTHKMMLILPSFQRNETTFLSDPETLVFIIPPDFIKKQAREQYIALEGLKQLRNRSKPILNEYFELNYPEKPPPGLSTKISAFEGQFHPCHRHLTPLLPVFSLLTETSQEILFIYHILISIPIHISGSSSEDVFSFPNQHKLPISFLIKKKLPDMCLEKTFSFPLYFNFDFQPNEEHKPRILHLQYYKEISLLKTEKILIHDFCNAVFEKLSLTKLMGSINSFEEGGNPFLVFVNTSEGFPDFEYMRNTLFHFEAMNKLSEKELLSAASLYSYFSDYFSSSEPSPTSLSIKTDVSIKNSSISPNFSPCMDAALRLHLDARPTEEKCISILYSKERRNYSVLNRFYDVKRVEGAIAIVLPSSRKHTCSPHPTFSMGTSAAVRRKGRITASISDCVFFPLSSALVRCFFSLHALQWRLEFLLLSCIYSSKLKEQIKLNCFSEWMGTPTFQGSGHYAHTFSLEWKLVQLALITPLAGLSAFSLPCPPTASVTLSDTDWDAPSPLCGITGAKYFYFNPEKDVYMLSPSTEGITAAPPASLTSSVAISLSLTAPITLAANYQRLEHLGDAILKCVVRLYCVASFHRELDVGSVSQKSAIWESNAMLAEKCKDLDIMKNVLGSAYASTQPLSHLREQVYSQKMLADVVEALIGAAYLSNCDFQLCHGDDAYRTAHKHFQQGMAVHKQPPLPLQPSTYVPEAPLPFWSSHLAMNAAMSAVDYFLGIPGMMRTTYEGISSFCSSLERGVAHTTMLLHGKSSSADVGGLWNLEIENSYLLTCARTHKSSASVEELLSVFRSRLVNNTFLAKRVLRRILLKHLTIESILLSDEYLNISAPQLQTEELLDFVDSKQDNPEHISKLVADFYEAMVAAYFLDIYLKEGEFNLMKVWKAFGEDFEPFYPSIRQCILKGIRQTSAGLEN